MYHAFSLIESISHRYNTRAHLSFIIIQNHLYNYLSEAFFSLTNNQKLENNISELEKYVLLIISRNNYNK